MAITTNLKRADGADVGANLFAGNGSNNGNQTFNIIQANGVDLGRGWYNQTQCSARGPAIGFINAAGVDVGTLLGKYGTLNCNCNCNCDCSDSDTDGCFVSGQLLTARGLVEVSEIQEGDLLWGADERWHMVLGVASSVTGGRRVYKLCEGACVTEEHVIFQGSCAYVANKELLYRSEGSILKTESGVIGQYDIPTDVSEIDGAGLIEVPGNTRTFSPISDSSFVGYLNGWRVLIAGQK